MDEKRFQQIALQVKQSTKHLTVIGDRMTDHWYKGTKIGKSKEDPETSLYRLMSIHTSPGGAANVLQSLGALKKGNTLSHYFVGTTEKHRVYSLSSHRIIIQADQDVYSEPVQIKGNIAKLFLSKFLVIADYGKRMLTWTRLEQLAEYAAPKSGIVVIFSPHIQNCRQAGDVKQVVRTKFGHWLWVMNDSEAAAFNKATGIRPRFCVVTRAGQDVLYYRDNVEAPDKYPVEPVDAKIVAGIGDVFLAALASAISAGHKVPVAAPFAIECCRRVLRSNRITTCAIRKTDMEV